MVPFNLVCIWSHSIASKMEREVKIEKTKKIKIKLGKEANVNILNDLDDL